MDIKSFNICLHAETGMYACLLSPTPSCEPKTVKVKPTYKDPQTQNELNTGYLGLKIKD